MCVICFTIGILLHYFGLFFFWYEFIGIITVPLLPYNKIALIMYARYTEEKHPPYLDMYRRVVVVGDHQ